MYFFAEMLVSFLYQTLVSSLHWLSLSQELGQLWTNALSWLDQSRQGIVGVSINFALQSLSRTGFNCQSTNFRDDLSVFVCTTYDDAHAKEIQEFVAQGGGLLIGGHAWHWSLTHSGENEMTDYPGMSLFHFLILKNIANN